MGPLANPAGLSLLMAFDDPNDGSSGGSDMLGFGNWTYPTTRPGQEMADVSSVKGCGAPDCQKSYPLTSKQRQDAEFFGCLDPVQYAKDKKDVTAPDPFKNVNAAGPDPWTPSRITFNISPTGVDATVNLSHLSSRESSGYHTPSFDIPRAAMSTPQGERVCPAFHSLSTIHGTDSSYYRTANDNSNLGMASYRTPPQHESRIETGLGPGGPMGVRTPYYTPQTNFQTPSCIGSLAQTYMDSSLNRSGRSHTPARAKAKGNIPSFVAKSPLMQEIAQLLTTITEGEVERLRKRLLEFQEDRRQSVI